jgi:hypothetical protein
MKPKFIITVIFLILSSSIVYSQTPGHLLFKGVPIDGTLKEYVTKMKQAGFILQSMGDGLAILKGDFAGYKDINIGVSTLKQKDLVHKVVVLFPELDSWSSLSGNYFTLKELLTEKYGEPSMNSEKFKGSLLEGDTFKMYKVQSGDCEYYSVFETDNGTIQLSIGSQDNSHCFVTLAYFDKTNQDEVKAKALGDL